MGKTDCIFSHGQPTSSQGTENAKGKRISPALAGPTLRAVIASPATKQ
jgi:hypothetical protein